MLPGLFSRSLWAVSGEERALPRQSGVQERGIRGRWVPRSASLAPPAEGRSSPGSRVEVLGRANHLNGRGLLRDRLYSLIEFALKCNLIFSEAVSSPFATLPQTGPHFPSFQGGAEHLLSEKRGAGSSRLCPNWSIYHPPLEEQPQSARPPTPALDGGAASLPGFPLELPALSDSSCSQLPNPHHEGRFFP